MKNILPKNLEKTLYTYINKSVCNAFIYLLKLLFQLAIDLSLYVFLSKDSIGDEFLLFFIFIFANTYMKI